MLGDTREAIAAEKLAVARPGAVVVLPDEEFASLVAGHEVRRRRCPRGGLGVPRPADGPREVEVALPGRLERRGDEVRDGAHNPDGARWLADRLEPGRYTIVASVLRGQGC